MTLHYRITKERLYEIAGRVNAFLEKDLNDWTVVVEGRNGYWAVDLSSKAGYKTLTTGTLREMFDFLRGMEAGLFILDRPESYLVEQSNT